MHVCPVFKTAYELDLLWFVYCDLCFRARRVFVLLCHVIVIKFRTCNCIPVFSIVHFICKRNKFFSLNFSFLRIFSNWVLLNYPRMLIGRAENAWYSILLQILTIAMMPSCIL